VASNIFIIMAWYYLSESAGYFFYENALFCEKTTCSI